MTKHLGTVPIGHGLEKMWRLSSDGSSVRLSLPGLPVEGARQPSTSSSMLARWT